MQDAAKASAEAVSKRRAHILGPDYAVKSLRMPIHRDFVVEDLQPAVARAVRADAVLERRVDLPGCGALLPSRIHSAMAST